MTDEAAGSADNADNVVEKSVEALEQSAELIEQSSAILEQLSGYGNLVLQSLSILVVGMAVVYTLQRLAGHWLYPRISDTRALKVFFGALYLLVLVVCVLVLLRELGFEVDLIGRLAVVAVLVGAVLVFFLAPFLPRLPFVLGDLVEVNGITGHVESISSFHTTIRKFDGTVVFIPNALMMGSRIANYSTEPRRRIEIALGTDPRIDPAESMRAVLALMEADTRVLEEPAPSAYIVGASAGGVEIRAYAWTRNSDWFKTCSDLWAGILEATRNDDQFAFALARFIRDPVGRGRRL